MILNPFKQVDFLYVYSLQAGVVICSSIGIFLSIVIFAVNLVAENSEIKGIIMAGQYCMVFTYCAFILIGFCFGMASAYQEKASVTKIGAIIQFVMFFYWLTLLGFSFLNNPFYTRILAIVLIPSILFWVLQNKSLGTVEAGKKNEEEERVCIENRCADHLWLQDGRWRLYSTFCDPADANLPIVNTNSSAKAVKKNLYLSGIVNKTVNASEILRALKKTKPHLISFEVEEEVPEPNTITDSLLFPKRHIGKSLLLMGSVFLSALEAFFFLYSATTLLSYSHELLIEESTRSEYEL